MKLQRSNCYVCAADGDAGAFSAARGHGPGPEPDRFTTVENTDFRSAGVGGCGATAWPAWS